MSRGLIDQAMDYLASLPPTNAVAACTMSATTNMNIASSAWRSLNAFTGYSKTNDYMNEQYFSSDTNGFKVLHKGVYHITADAHMTAAAAGNAFGMRIYDYTSDGQINNARFAYANGVVWADFSTETVKEIDANHIILPQWERYSGSQNWRPHTATFIIRLIKLVT